MRGETLSQMAAEEIRKRIRRRLKRHGKTYRDLADVKVTRGLAPAWFPKMESRSDRWVQKSFEDGEPLPIVTAVELAARLWALCRSRLPETILLPLVEAEPVAIGVLLPGEAELLAQMLAREVKKLPGVAASNSAIERRLVKALKPYEELCNTFMGEPVEQALRAAFLGHNPGEGAITGRRFFESVLFARSIDEGGNVVGPSLLELACRRYGDRFPGSPRHNRTTRQRRRG